MRKRRLASLACLASIAFVGAPAWASNTTPVNITSVTPTNYGWVYITHTGTRGSVPSCGAATSARYAFSVGTAGGQAMLSTILTAFASHKPVTFIGTGTCDASAPDTESVAYLVLTD